ncbi:arylsulfatase [Sphingopyxis yananensis]|uniref:arylsulfatase n=1 Tax=Sphingopyxis yananensis TaxID=2886687 RepID=UPI001D0F84C6|nr:arylsulfatase [Sphingopyxis yananensis]MCC2601577.1 arylsulfatase [Sphingopyxis yananensis]
MLLWKNSLRGVASATLLAATALTPASAKDAPSPRPNIVLIVLDDVGFAELGSYGSEIRTPHMDSLARNGLRYNRFDSKAICSSTRAALLTGRNPQSVGMLDLASSAEAADPTASDADRGELPRNIDTVAERLRGIGYTSWAVGKWHLAPRYDETQGKASWPLQRGFDHFYGFLSGWTDQYKPKLVRDNDPIPVPDKPDYILTPDLIDQAISAFDPNAMAQDKKPRFVYLALGTAHAPIQAPKSYIDAYQGQYAAGWDAIRESRFQRQKQLGVIPANSVLNERNSGDRAWSDLNEQEKQVFARFMESYAGFITQADDEIGRLIQHLKSIGQYENTLFILLSDNGAAPEPGQNGGFWHPYDPRTPVSEMAANLDKLGGPETQSLYQRPWAMAGVAPFRRYKLWPYAGGVRTPLIISWPKEIRDKGAVRSQYVDAVDIGATLLDAAGTAYQSTINGVAQVPIAGQSVRATFTSAHAGGRKVQFFALRGNRSITAGDWKAVAIHNYGTDFELDRWSLFNVKEDFSESRDLAAEYPLKLKELQTLWWSEARRYSNPPLSEPSPRIQSMRQYADEAEQDGN